MSQQSAFDRQHIEESAVIQQPGLLEQFNLPPAMIAFMRKNQRMLWIITGCIALVVVAGSLYKQYADHRAEKAVSALATAMQAEGDEKQKLLAGVIDDFGATSSGRWGRIELAHLAVEKGENDKAISEFASLLGEVGDDDPVAPLLLSALGVLYERNSQFDKALETFSRLAGFKGFEESSSEAMGRVYEQKGDKAKAIEMYSKAIADNPEDPQVLPNPNRETIQARINSLQE